MKYILSLIFYHIGDFFSKRSGRISAELYQRFMHWSLLLDTDEKVWKKK